MHKIKKDSSTGLPIHILLRLQNYGGAFISLILWHEHL
ncbi:hypothetical protein KP509_07G033700 [Ceratopteris richardii]|uniref:Uncharacterized protein n=1 Tax=Ceratopteris richardii TaxID=49495 RepID=A0A8T2UH60_CERRI|nr:hypothetical protein KP509_07G033700 [Ceratopteris richardii]